MNFERNNDPYKTLRIGSGQARKMICVSVGGNREMDKDQVLSMIKHWQNTKNHPNRVYPLVDMPDGRRQFVEPQDLSGELIEWMGKIYQLP